MQWYLSPIIYYTHMYLIGMVRLKGRGVRQLRQMVCTVMIEKRSKRWQYVKQKVLEFLVGERRKDGQSKKTWKKEVDYEGRWVGPRKWVYWKGV